jgi:integrase
VGTTGQPRQRRSPYLGAAAEQVALLRPRTEVPEEPIFGRLPERQAPHIYSAQEIEDLLAAARRLAPRPGLRGLTYETLFGLIACTGMRVSEAVSLRNGDVDLKHAMLTIRRSKFSKSRQVPILLSAVQALRQYRWMRDLAGASQEETAAFFVSDGVRRRTAPIRRFHAEHVFVELRDELGWVNRGTHHAPRIHDLRHTFVVRRILLWQRQGVDVDQAMLSLSTYVGHAKVTNTYWYLQAVPELMAVSAQRFESCMPEAQDA